MIPVPKSFVLLIAAVASGPEFAEAGVVTTHPFEGITFITRSETTPRTVTLNVVLVDLRAPGISFKLTSSGGARDTIRQTTLDFLNQEKAQVAVNVHFFVPFPSGETDVNIVGLAASLGNVYSPFESQPVGPGHVDQSYAILPFSPALNIDRSNRVTIVHRDPAYPDNRHVVEGLTLWNAFSGSAQIVTDGARTLPAYSGFPTGLNPTRTYTGTNSWYSLPRARTAAGVTTDQRTLVLLTVDQAGGSGGLTVGEVADLLIKDYHVANALNLDGGGSTTLVMQDPVTQTGRIMNVSGDNPRGRAVGSNLAVFAQPLPSTRPARPPR